MIPKKRYDLTVRVYTRDEMVNSTQKIQVDTTIYGVQTVHRTAEFRGINQTDCEPRVSGNFLDTTSAFALFWYDEADPQITFRSLLYGSVRHLITTTGGVRSICVVIPTVIRPDTNEGPIVDMNPQLVEGILEGLQNARQASCDVIKNPRLTLYLQVPLSMKDALVRAIKEML